MNTVSEKEKRKRLTDRARGSLMRDENYFVHTFKCLEMNDGSKRKACSMKN